MGRWNRTAFVAALALVTSMVGGAVPVAHATHPPGGHTYTFDADFDQGSLINLVHNPANQLQLDDTSKPFPFIWVAASQRGTVVKIDTVTGQVLGEYWSAPQPMAKNPSRTTVDKDGNVWVGNRDEASGNKGSAVHIGLKENGECVDRNNNGVIDTSTGLGDIRSWSNAGGANTNGGVSTAADECIIHFVRTNSVRNRHVSVDQNNNVWIGGGAFADSVQYYHLFDEDGNSLRSINVQNPADTAEPPVGYCCYGGLVDPNGVLWSATLDGASVLRFDPSYPNGDANLLTKINVGRTTYGMGIDSLGNIWVSNWTYNTVQKISAAGALLGTFASGGSGVRGVTVTPDDTVWFANSFTNTVTRLNNTGGIVASVPVGAQPTGLSVDAAGKVWVTNLSSHDVMRINPATNTVDLTVSLGAGAGPYNYSDMTGSILIGPPTSGTWSVVHDSGTAGATWGTVSWNAMVPATGGLAVTASSSEDGVTFGPEQAVTSGADLSVANGRYLKVSVRFDRSTEGVSPVLYDLSIRPNAAPTVDLTVMGGAVLEGSTSVSLQANAVDPDGDPLTYTWSLSGPGTLAPMGNLATYTNDDGPASATVTVTVSDGMFTASASAPVGTMNAAPTAMAGTHQVEYWGIPVTFWGSATDPSMADTAAGLNPAWDFGDGNTGSGYSATHAYANPGSYVVTLSVADKDGGMDSDTTMAVIQKRPSSLAYTGAVSQAFGQPGTLSATLGDLADPGTAMLGGRTVTFVVDGDSYTATTDAAGNASVGAPAMLMPGTYTVDVLFAEDGHYLASSTQVTLVVTNSVGKVTAGSLRMEGKARGGLNAQSDGTAVKGELQFQNAAGSFHAHTVTALGISPDGTKAWMAGVGKDGRTFTAYLEDNGEPGSADVYKLWIDGVLQAGSGQLTGGNVQIHR